MLARSLPPGVPVDIYERLVSIIENAGAHSILDTSDEALVTSCKAKPYLMTLSAASEKRYLQLRMGIYILDWIPARRLG